MFKKLQNDDVPIPPPGHPDWALLPQHLAAQIYNVARIAALLIPLVTVLLWPSDLLLLQDQASYRETFARFRVGAIAIFLSMAAALTLLPVARRQPALVALPFSVLALGWVSFCLGDLGGLETPWYYALLLAPLLPMVAPSPLGMRVVFVTALCLANLIGFFGLHPQHFQSPWAPDAIFLMVTVWLFSVLSGHIRYRSAVRAFFHSRAIIAGKQALEELNASLDRRVAEQTAELRALSEGIVRAREEERARIARDLHDELGQQLAASRYALANVRRLVERGQVERLPETLVDMDRLATQSSSTVRRILADLHPPLLDALGFVGACEWLARDMGSRLGFREAFRCVGEDPPPKDLSLAVYRVLQETLNNVGRHAKATFVSVELILTPSAVTLTVTDDGCGLPQTMPLPSEHGGYGILGMRERARAFGGTLDIESPPEGGTRISLRVPTTKPEAST